MTITFYFKFFNLAWVGVICFIWVRVIENFPHYFHRN